LSQITERGLTPTQRIDEMMGLYKNSVDSMIDKHMYDEAVVFVSIMTKLTHMCSTEVIRASVRGWVQDKCRIGYKHNELVRELVGLFCALNARLGDIDMIKEMTGDITYVIVSFFNYIVMNVELLKKLNTKDSLMKLHYITGLQVVKLLSNVWTILSHFWRMNGNDLSD
jgi:hypothetical protein